MADGKRTCNRIKTADKTVFEIGNEGLTERMMNNTDEFLRGQRDCAEGLPHKEGQPEFYDRGYQFQYFIEQQKTEKARWQESRT
jgi:hypothetical protein